MPSSRLVSYNILEGLRPLGAQAEERRTLDRARAGDAQKVVSALGPDILALNEALFCRAYEGRELNYAEIFDFPHQVAALYDRAWGNAILSRYPIIASREYRIYNRGGLAAQIQTPMGVVTVASYHPHPDRLPSNKANDLCELVAGVTGPLLLCGDFNCINPSDRVDPDELRAGFAGFSPAPAQDAQRFIDSGRLVFQRLTELGLHDAIPLSGRRYSVPTDLINTDKRSAMRIDHIVANQEVRIVAGEVVQTAATNRASDHHPVMVDFAL